ncbi:MAG TPA: hypothetical protein P5013_00805 [Methanoregula sp.]|nr:hypothetical protein [Methanoregula sp.]
MVSVTLCGNDEGDLLSPPEGEAACGGRPSSSPYTAILHGACPYEAASTRGFIAHR